MKEIFSVGEAAKVAETTAETLRHYDRIGLIKPSQKDEQTGYRYYTNQDIVKINTVRALQQMDLSLKKIKEVLEYDDLNKIIDFLTEAEAAADEKIKAVKYSKSKIQAAKEAYENKLYEQTATENLIIKRFPKRVIMVSDTLKEPTLDNLWNYLKHFYDKIPEALQNKFSFEDTAGIYTENGQSALFAVCVNYAQTDGIKILPPGRYLCADCSEENRIEKLSELLQLAETKYHVSPEFTVQQIIISGILQWKYQIQVYIEE